MNEFWFRLEPFSPAVLLAYKAFASWLDFEPSKIEWKLRNGPFGPGVAMVVRNKDDIVGLNAYQPAVIRNAAGDRLRGHQSIDTVVSERMRGQRLFTRMFNAYYEQTDAEFIYGFPNKSSAPGFFNKLGWQNFGQVPMRIRPMRTGFIARRLHIGFFDVRVPYFERTRTTSSVVSEFKEQHELAWHETLRQSPTVWGIDRNVAYLNWRYRNHPTERYTILGKEDGSFVVWQVVTKHEARILYILELLGSHANSTIDLLRETHSIALAEGAELALAWTPDCSPVITSFRSCGYHHFPERIRSNEINFGARILTDKPAPAAKQDWFLSYSDSDTV